jgi:hypothetical protein
MKTRPYLGAFARKREPSPQAINPPQPDIKQHFAPVPKNIFPLTIVATA